MQSPATLFKTMWTQFEAFGKVDIPNDNSDTERETYMTTWQEVDVL